MPKGINIDANHKNADWPKRTKDDIDLGYPPPKPLPEDDEETVELAKAAYPALLLFKANQPRDKWGRWARTGHGNPSKGLWEEADARRRFGVEEGFTPPTYEGQIAWATMQQGEMMYTLAGFSPKKRAEQWNKYFANQPGDSKERLTAKRVLRAKVSGKARNDVTTAFARDKEHEVAAMVGGKWLRDHEPEDVLCGVRSGVRVGLEVKSLITNANDKLTMNTDSMKRKTGKVKSKRQSDVIFTVGIDARKEYRNGKWQHLDTKTMQLIQRGGSLYSGHRVYFYPGVGSPYLKSCIKVKNAAHLQQLIDDHAAKWGKKHRKAVK